MDADIALSLRMSGTATKTVDLATTRPNAVLTGELIARLTTGTALNQANLIYADSGTIAPSAYQYYDLSGTVTDVFGTNVVLTTVKALYVRNTSTTLSILKVGGGTGGDGTNAWDTWITSTAANGSEGVLVRAGGCMLIWNPTLLGYPVTAGSIDILAIQEMSALAASFDMVIVGVE